MNHDRAQTIFKDHLSHLRVRKADGSRRPNTQIAKDQQFLRYQALLEIFWAEFGERVHPSSRLSLIKLFGDGKLEWFKRFARPTRDDYNLTKNVKHPIGDTCRVCGEPAQCRHHIINIRNGGRNHQRNLIDLCNRCHGEVHPWLKRRLR